MSQDKQLFQHYASRLFVVEGESYTSDPITSLPLKPDEWHSSQQRGREHWNNAPCIVLLGEPGSGKSREFENWRDELHDKGQEAFLITLRDCYDTSLTLPQMAGVEEDALSAALSDHQTTPMTLFLDALDEGRLHFPTVLQHLIAKLRQAPKNRPIHLRLSCRSRDWRAWSDKEDLGKLYPDREDQTGVTIIEILPLDSAAVLDLAREKLQDKQANQFIHAALERNVLGLAGHPLTLAMMLEVFAKDGKLANNRTELFNRACALLAQESNRVHGEKGKSLTTDKDRLGYAKHLAALSVLSNHTQIHIPDKDEPLPQSLDGTLVTDKDRLNETLDTGLFTQSLPGSFRFLHPLLADFLAACWVSQRIQEGLRPRALMPLLGCGETGMPTPLRNFAAWLACFSTDIRQHVLRTDPATLMRGDVGILSPDDRTSLVQALAKRYAKRDFQREVDGFGDLACGLEAEILEDLLKPSRSLAVRRMVLDMGISGKRKDIAAEAWKIGADPKEDQNLRERAVRLVYELAPDEYVDRLLTLLDCPAEEDPDDELAGIVLDWLYPQYLNTQQALTALRQPRRERLGSFQNFWEITFPYYLSASDETIVLDALAGQLAEPNGLLADPRPKLFRELLKRRLDRKTLDDIYQLVSWMTVLNEIGVEPPLHDIIADRAEIKRALLRHKALSHPRDMPYQYWQTPFPWDCLKADDFDWLEELCANGSLTDDVRMGVFIILESVFRKGEFIPVDRFYRLSKLVEFYPFLKEFWNSCLVCDLEKEPWLSLSEQVRKQKEKPLRDAVRLAALTEKIPQIEQGLAPGIFEAVDQQNKQTGIFGHPNLEKLAEATSPAFAMAADKGFRAVWNSPPGEITNWDSPENSFSYWHCAFIYGLELTEAIDPTNWADASEAQMEAASLIALRFLDPLPQWFFRLCEVYSGKFQNRIMGYLSHDAALPTTGTLTTSIAKIFRVAESSLYISDMLLKWFLNNPIPTNLDLLKKILRLAYLKPSNDLAVFVEQQAKSVLESSRENQSDNPRRASLLLAAWWLVEWETAQECIEINWLAGDKPFDKIRSFYDSIGDITWCRGRAWPESIPFAATVKIAPWLHLEPLPQRAPQKSVWIRSDDFEDVRSVILGVIASGPSDQARESLQNFLELPQFEPEYQTILHHLGEIDRRMAYEGWFKSKPTPAEVEQVLSSSARIVRTVEEFYWLAQDICNTDLREALRSDASLIPLLWQGKKTKPKNAKTTTGTKTKTDNRTPSDEKPLQAVLINQLYLLLKGTPLLHAREPESRDAKKEDCRLQVSLGNGEKAMIAIEIKQTKHKELWTAPKTQLVDKYMLEHKALFGLYLVGWYGADQLVAERKNHGFSTPDDLEKALQEQVDQDLAETGKQVKVIVYDCSV